MNFSNIFSNQIDSCLQEIDSMDIEPIARKTGFQMRQQRKIPLLDILKGILALSATPHPSLERVAASIARSARCSYSKQALHKRLRCGISRFLTKVFTRCLQPALAEANTHGLFSSFPRVLLHDSTTIALPDRYAPDFPGSANGRQNFSQLKIQLVVDLLKSSVEQILLSGFTRNDQRAAPDILTLLQPGDLIIRDLGYFVLSTFAQIIERQAFFLSRYHHGTALLDPQTKRPIPLAKLLKKQGFFDAPVLLGETAQVPVRLVALALPDAVANERRRRLRQNRDRSLNPTKEHLCLLGWNIFVTNVSEPVWPAKKLAVIYRLRWRIEMIFKAWKSYLTLRELSDQCLVMIHLSVMTKLIFCAFLYRTYQEIETMYAESGCHVSLLRVTKILAPLALSIEAAFVNLSLPELLNQLIEQHGFYEKRKDRKNFQELLLEVCGS